MDERYFLARLREFIEIDGTVLAPVASNHPFWWAVVLEFASHRKERGHATTLVDFDTASLSSRGHGRQRLRISRLCRHLGQDSPDKARRAGLRVGVDFVHLGLDRAQEVPLPEAAARIQRMNALSSASHHMRTAFPEQVSSECVRHYEDTWLQSFVTWSNYLARKKPAAVLIWNTRFAVEGAIRFASEIHQVPVYAYEIHGPEPRVLLMRDTIHDPSEWLRTSLAVSKVSPDELLRVASSWAGERGLISQRTPEMRDLKPLRFLYLNSTSRENSFLRESPQASMDAQTRHIESLVQYARSEPLSRSVIRLHPNLRGANPFDQEYWRGLARRLPANVDVIDFQRSTRTSDLFVETDCVVGHGSSGILEAAFCGHRVIDGSNGVHSVFGVAPPHSGDFLTELRLWQASGAEALAASRMAAMRLVYVQRTGGLRMVHSRLTRRGSTFKGESLNPAGLPLRTPF